MQIFPLNMFAAMHGAYHVRPEPRAAGDEPTVYSATKAQRAAERRGSTKTSTGEQPKQKQLTATNSGSLNASPPHPLLRLDSKHNLSTVQANPMNRESEDSVRYVQAFRSVPTWLVEILQCDFNVEDLQSSNVSVVEAEEDEYLDEAGALPQGFDRNTSGSMTPATGPIGGTGSLRSQTVSAATMTASTELLASLRDRDNLASGLGLPQGQLGRIQESNETSMTSKAATDAAGKSENKSTTSSSSGTPETTVKTDGSGGSGPKNFARTSDGAGGNQTPTSMHGPGTGPEEKAMRQASDESDESGKGTPTSPNDHNKSQRSPSSSTNARGAWRPHRKTVVPSQTVPSESTTPTTTLPQSNASASTNAAFMTQSVGTALTQSVSSGNPGSVVGAEFKADRMSPPGLQSTLVPARPSVQVNVPVGTSTPASHNTMDSPTRQQQLLREQQEKYHSDRGSIVNQLKPPSEQEVAMRTHKPITNRRTLSGGVPIPFTLGNYGSNDTNTNSPGSGTNSRTGTGMKDQRIKIRTMRLTNKLAVLLAQQQLQQLAHGGYGSLANQSVRLDPASNPLLMHLSSDFLRRTVGMHSSMSQKGGPSNPSTGRSHHRSSGSSKYYYGGRGTLSSQSPHGSYGGPGRSRSNRYTDTGSPNLLSPNVRYGSKPNSRPRTPNMPIPGTVPEVRVDEQPHSPTNAARFRGSVGFTNRPAPGTERGFTSSAPPLPRVSSLSDTQPKQQTIHIRVDKAEGVDEAGEEQAEAEERAANAASNNQPATVLQHHHPAAAPYTASLSGALPLGPPGLENKRSTANLGQTSGSVPLTVQIESVHGTKRPALRLSDSGRVLPPSELSITVT